MNTRERFLKSVLFEPVDQVPNFELGAWEQTVERWYREGMPEDKVPHMWTLRGNDYLGLDDWDFVPVDIFMMPRFEVEIMEENERTVPYRDEEGTVRRSLKEGQVGTAGSPFMSGQRMSMDQIVSCAVTNRDDFEQIKRRYDPSEPARYPEEWDSLVEGWRTRTCPL